MTFHDLIGDALSAGRRHDEADAADVALYNVEVTGPEHAIVVANRACRAALGDRGVAHLTVAKDAQMMKLAADKRSMGNPGARTSSSWLPAIAQRRRSRAAGGRRRAERGRRVAILVGQGALAARDEVDAIADRLGAPVAKALLGKAVLPDDSPFTTGGIGHLGTAPSSWAMKNCDTRSDPRLDHAVVSNITRRLARRAACRSTSSRIASACAIPSRSGWPATSRRPCRRWRRCSRRKTDRSFLQEAQQPMADWNRLLAEVEATPRSPLRPQMVIKALSDLMADDAVISLDCGANTHFAARHLLLRASQRLTGTGMMASMAPGLPFAIAASSPIPRASRSRSSATAASPC